MAKKCGIYVRVSTSRQATEGESLDAQTKRLKDYIRARSTEKDPWRLVDVYREEGISAKEGSIEHRPEFQRLLGDIQRRRVNMVLVTKIDRLTRSLRDFYDIWRAFERRKIEFFSLDENFDSSTLMGRFALKLIVLFAELEREITGERTRSVLEWRASQGFWNGSHVVGFRTNEDGILVPKPDELKLVRLVFRKCRQLGSVGAVLRFLNEQGYRKPKYETKRGTSRGGNRFDKQTVAKLLRNPVYLGKIRYGTRSERDGNGGETEVPVVYEGKHAPVIDAALFEEVQGILDRNRRRRRGPKTNDHVYLLRGLLRDARCGHMMTPYSSGGGKRPHLYYKCTARTHQGKHGCDTKYVPAEAVEKLVLEFVKKVARDGDYVKGIVDEANNMSSDILQKLNTEYGSTTRRLGKVQKELHNMARAVARGGDKKFRSIAEEMGQLENERARLEEQQAEIKAERDKVEQHVLSTDVIVQTLRHFSEILERATKAELQRLLPQIIEVVEWHEDPKKPGSGEIKVALFEEFRPERLEGLEVTWTKQGLTTGGRSLRLESRLAPRGGLEPPT